MISSRRLVALIHLVLWGLFALAFAAFVNQFTYGPWVTHLFSFDLYGIEFSGGLRFDALSTVLFLMVTLLAKSIGHYSLRFLEGERRKSYFFIYLLFTLLAVSLFILSSGFITLLFGWFGVSAGLHKLLTYYDHRPHAVYAARKRLLISSLGDLALVAAAATAYHLFGSFEFSEIFGKAASQSQPYSWVGLGFLIMLAAVIQSAQFPFHFWLPETMETPTPVSALMHAGIINGGGFTLIRLSPILQHAEPVLFILAGWGAISAVFGALVMVTQTDIKKKLAYSTLSQMGMMIFACGLGAYSIALFHIVAHSLYKATSFLTTGTLVDESKKTGFKMVKSSNIFLSSVSLVGLAVIVAGILFSKAIPLAYFTYTAVLILGFSQVISTTFHREYSRVRVYSRIAGIMAVAVGVYLVAEATLRSQLLSALPAHWSGGLIPFSYAAVNLLTYALFVTGFWMTSKLIGPKTQFMKKAYFWLWNGGYLEQPSTRVLNLIWPSTKRSLS